MRRLKPTSLTLAAILFISLVGCGGGGDQLETVATGTSNIEATTTSASALALASNTVAIPAELETATAQATSVPYGADAVMTQNVKSVVGGVGWVAPLMSEWQTIQTSYSASFTGRAWYVDPTLGNDANPGSVAAPWRTLAPTVTMKMNSGDALLLKCGEVIRKDFNMEEYTGWDLPDHFPIIAV